MSDSDREINCPWQVRAREQLMSAIVRLLHGSTWCLILLFPLGLVSYILADCWSSLATALLIVAGLALLVAVVFVAAAGIATFAWLAVQTIYFFQFSLRSLLLIVLWAGTSVTVLVKATDLLPLALGSVSLVMVALVVLCEIAKAGNPAANRTEDRPNEQAPREDDNGASQ